MRNLKTSRVLNDDSYLMGLSFGDITMVGMILLGLLIIGKAVGMTSMLWALVLAVSLLIALIPIRLRFRRKIIRDSLGYVRLKGVRRVSTNFRK